MKVGVIRFPGSNCDRDVYHALELAGGEPDYVWWNQKDLSNFDAIVIPGGFSYGDYLRNDSIARGEVNTSQSSSLIILQRLIISSGLESLSSMVGVTMGIAP